jgi:hypothetical protein
MPLQRRAGKMPAPQNAGYRTACRGKVAAKRKSPDRWPGRTFLQELLYQTSNPLVKHKISLFFELKKNRTFQKAGALAPA